MRKKIFSLIIVLAVCMSSVVVFAQTPRIFINEFVASNRNGITDEDSDASDWVEIYNAGDQPVNLLGFFLTDDSADPTKWAFPSVILGPESYLLVWISGKDRPNPAAPHASFKLSKDGEHLGLYNAQGALIDGLVFPPQQTDVSYARYPDGNPDWFFYNQPSPLQTNPEPDASSRVANPVFTPDDGFFSGGVSITIQSPSAGAQIRYTTDGSFPEEGSPLYTQPMDFSTTDVQCIVIRARAFQSGLGPSAAISRVFFLNSPHQMPVLNFITDPDNLWDPEIGLYVNPTEKGDLWERPLSVQMYSASGENLFRIEAGIRMHGTYTRIFEKKSFRLYFRSEYGENRLDYKLFEDLDMNSFKRLIVRNCGDLLSSLMRDPILETLWRRQGGSTSSNRYTALYINGEYWGIYNLRERIDRYYVDDHFGIDDDDVNLIKASYWFYELEDGFIDSWNQDLDVITSGNLTVQQIFDQASQLFEISEITDQNIYRIYTTDTDWPHNNIFYFKSQLGGTKWRPIMWDADRGFSTDYNRWPFDHNTLAWAIRDEVRTDLSPEDNPYLLWGADIQRNLLTNDDYRIRFINRFADLLNTVFQPENIHVIIDELAAKIRSEIPRDAVRWGEGVYSMDNWESQLLYLKNFARARPGYVREHIVSEFGLEGMCRIKIIPHYLGGGSVRINTINPVMPFDGIYFKGVPVELEAMANPGSRFEGWEGAVESSQSTITVTPHLDEMILHPVFTSLEPPTQTGWFLY